MYNRVDNNGKIISDKFERKRSEKIVKHLKDKYGLTYSDGKGQTRTERLHYTERTKFEIQNAVKTALQASRTWQQFTDRLKQQCIEVEFKRRRGSDDVIEGITFIKGGVRFKGSQIGRQYTYARLNERLSWDERRQTAQQGQTEQTRQHEQPRQDPNQEQQYNKETSFDLSLVDSMNRTNRNLCVLRDALKIVSERQKESRKELLDTLGSKLEALSAKGDMATAEEIRALRLFIAEQTGKLQHKQVTHDQTTKTWWLVGIGTILFFCMSLLTTKIYDQSKKIEELQLSGWKYRALRATLPATTRNVVNAIRNCDKASFCVIAQDDIQPKKYTTYYRSVIAFGRIQIIEDENEKLKTARLLGNRYNPNDEESLQKELEHGFARMLMIRFDIEYLTGKAAIELVRKQS